MSTHTIKQAKASEAEVDALIAWFNKRERSAAASPPWRRVVFGYQILVENACDPTKDYLAWKPGIQLDKSFVAFWEAQARWSQATFGKDSEKGPLGALKHLAKEAVEAQEKPTDLMEFVDCLFLTFDATRRAGFTQEQLLTAAWEKLAINQTRTWPKPTPGDEPVEHDRRGESAGPALESQVWGGGEL